MSKKAIRLEELLDLAEAQARRILIGGKESLLPSFLLVYPDGSEAIVGTPWSNDHEKASAIAVVKHAMLRGDVIRYSFVCEAWSVFLGEGEDLPEQRPSEHPDRYECVVITACDLRRETIRSLRIMRDADGNCTELVNQNWETGKVSGSLTEMLKP